MAKTEPYFYTFKYKADPAISQLGVMQTHRLMSLVFEA